MVCTFIVCMIFKISHYFQISESVSSFQSVDKPHDVFGVTAIHIVCLRVFFEVEFQIPFGFY